MLCSQCNTAAPDNAAFCPKCGQRLSASAPPVENVAPAAAPATAAERFRAAMPAATPNPEPEHDLWVGTYTAKAMIGQFILAGVVTLAAIVLAVLVQPFGWIAAAIVIPVMWAAILLNLLIKRLGIEYRLTTQRFLHKQGILRRVADQILLVDIDDITYEQGPLGRMLGYGTIILRAKDMSIHEKDKANDKLQLEPIENVQHIADLIDNARREERRKRAIYMASA